MQKIILFDIDHTLFDTQHFFDTMINIVDTVIQYPQKEEYVKIAQEVFKQSKNEIGRFGIPEFAENMTRKFDISIDANQIEKLLWDSKNFQESLYKEDGEVLKRLQELGYMLGIFSTGDLRLQQKKIESLQYFFHPDDVHIYSAKEQELKKITKQYSDKKLYIVDDFLEVLAEVKVVSPQATAVWINRQEKELPNHFIPDFTIINLQEIFSIFENSLDK